MERSLIAHLKLGERNKVQGFVENIRNKRTMAFLVYCRGGLSYDEINYRAGIWNTR